MGKEKRAALEQWIDQFNAGFDNCGSLVDQFFYLSKYLRFSRNQQVLSVIEEVIELKVQELADSITKLSDPEMDDFCDSLATKLHQSSNSAYLDMQLLVDKKQAPEDFSFSPQTQARLGTNELILAISMEIDKVDSRFTNGLFEKLDEINRRSILEPTENDLANKTKEQYYQEKIEERRQYIGVYDGNVPSEESRLDPAVMAQILEKDSRSQGVQLFTGVMEVSEIREMILDQDYMTEAIEMDSLPVGKSLTARDRVLEKVRLLEEHFEGDLPETLLDPSQEARQWSQELARKSRDAAEALRDYIASLRGQEVSLEQVGTLKKLLVRVEVLNPLIYQGIRESHVIRDLEEKAQKDLVEAEELLPRAEELQALDPENKLSGIVEDIRSKAQAVIRRYGVRALEDPESYRQGLNGMVLADYEESMRQYRQSVAAFRQEYRYFAKEQEPAALDGQEPAALEGQEPAALDEQEPGALKGDALAKVDQIHGLMGGFLLRYATEERMAILSERMKATASGAMAQQIRNMRLEDLALLEPVMKHFAGLQRALLLLPKHPNFRSNQILSNLQVRVRDLANFLGEYGKNSRGATGRREALRKFREEYRLIAEDYKAAVKEGLLQPSDNTDINDAYEMIGAALEYVETPAVKTVLNFYEKKFAKEAKFKANTAEAFFERNAMGEIEALSRRILEKVGDAQGLESMDKLLAGSAHWDHRDVYPSVFGGTDPVQIGGEYTHVLVLPDAAEFCEQMMETTEKLLQERPNLKQEDSELYLDILMVREQLETISQGLRPSQMLEFSPEFRSLTLHRKSFIETVKQQKEKMAALRNGQAEAAVAAENVQQEDVVEDVEAPPILIPEQMQEMPAVPVGYLDAQIATVEYYERLRQFCQNKAPAAGDEARARQALLAKTEEILQKKREFLEHLLEENHEDSEHLLRLVGADGLDRIRDEELPSDIRQIEDTRELLQMGWPLSALPYQRYLQGIFQNVVKDLDQNVAGEHDVQQDMLREIQKTLGGMADAFKTPEKAMEFYRGMERCQKIVDRALKYYDYPGGQVTRAQVQKYASLTQFRGEGRERKEIFEKSWKDLGQMLKTRADAHLAADQNVQRDLLALGDMFVGADRFFYRNSPEYQILKRALRRMETLYSHREDMNRAEYEKQFSECADGLRLAARSYAVQKLGENRGRKSAHGIKRLNSALTILHLLSPEETEGLEHQYGAQLQDLSKTKLDQGFMSKRYLQTLLDETLQFARGENVSEKLDAEAKDSGDAKTAFERSMEGYLKQYRTKQGQVLPKLNVEQGAPGRELTEDEVALFRVVVNQMNPMDGNAPAEFENAMHQAAEGDFAGMGQILGRMLHTFAQNVRQPGRDLFGEASLRESKRMAEALRQIQDSPKLLEAISEEELSTEDRDLIKALGELTALYEKRLTAQQRMANIASNGQEGRVTSQEKKQLIMDQVNYELIKQLAAKEAENAAKNGLQGIPGVIRALSGGSEAMEQQFAKMADGIILTKFTRQSFKSLTLYGSDRIAAEVSSGISAMAARDAERQRNAQPALHAGNQGELQRVDQNMAPGQPPAQV